MLFRAQDRSNLAFDAQCIAESATYCSTVPLELVLDSGGKARLVGRAMSIYARASARDRYPSAKI